MVSLSMGSLEAGLYPPPPAPARDRAALRCIVRRSCREASPPSSSPSLLAGCAGKRAGPDARRSSRSPPAWKTLLGDFVAPPLAADGRRVYVATRDGAVRALDPATGRWRGRPRASPAA